MYNPMACHASVQRAAQLERTSSDCCYGICAVILDSRQAPQRVKQLHEVTEVAVGLTHFVAVTNVGQVWTWGRSREGAMGTGNEEGGLRQLHVKPVPVRERRAAAAAPAAPLAPLPPPLPPLPPLPPPPRSRLPFEPRLRNPKRR